MVTRVRFETWAFGLLLVTLLVILWGAFVRVTGSGAGCADHWPLCNGEFVPRAPKVETMIELTHRVTSALSGLFSIVVLVLAYRSYDRGSTVRRAALLQFVLMLIEGAIGALLVKKGLVAKDTSSARAFVVGLHLVNTFLLIGAQAWTVFAARHPGPFFVTARKSAIVQLTLLLVLTLLLGASGAVTALGDTLFPSASLAEGIAQDFASDAHFLIRLRIWHPLLAILTGAFIVVSAQHMRSAWSSPRVSFWASSVTVIYVLQIILGSLNLYLLAPAPVQILHLLFADLTWLSLIGLFVAVLQDEGVTASPAGTLSAIPRK